MHTEKVASYYMQELFVKARLKIGLDQLLCSEFEISRGDTVSCGMLGSPQPENSDAALSARRVQRNKDTSSVGYICFSSSLLLSLSFGLQRMAGMRAVMPAVAA